MNRLYLIVGIYLIQGLASSQQPQEKTNPPSDIKTPEEPSLPVINFSLSSAYWSSYIIQNGLKLHGNVIQSDLLTQLPKNFYLDAFWSVGLNDNNLSSDAGDEIDWTVGWGTKVFDKLGIDLHISYYDLFDIFHYRNEDLIFPYAEINYGDIDLFDWLHFTPYLALENPFSAKGDDLSSGILAHAGIRHTINVIDMVDIVGRFDFLYDDGALGLDNSLIGRYEIGMQWKVNKYLSIAGPWIKYSDLYTRVSAFDPRQDEIVYGGGLILIFGL